MNYPPGVTGLEFEIAGPDYEKEIEDRPCPKCGADALMEYGYRREQWVQCLRVPHGLGAVQRYRGTLDVGVVFQVPD